MFEHAELDVLIHNRHLSIPVLQMWDIGLRPMFPVLKHIVEKLSKYKDDLLDIKVEWIEIMKQFLGPLSNLDSTLCQNEEPGFHCYILEKKS